MLAFNSAFVKKALAAQKTSSPKDSSSIANYLNRIICGDSIDVLKKFPNKSIDSVVTSPPYYALRDYGMTRQIGLEQDFMEYLERLWLVFDQIKGALKDEGTIFIVIGDSYGGSGTAGGIVNRKRSKGSKSRHSLNLAHSKGRYAKCLLQIPARFAVGMIERGWTLRNEIIWHKPNCLPTSTKDRFTVDFEKIFFFTKAKKYFFNQQFEPLRNPDRLKRRYLNPDHHHKWQNTDKILPGQPGSNGEKPRQSPSNGQKQAMRMENRDSQLPGRTFRRLSSSLD